MPKSIIFLYTSNKQEEFVIKKHMAVYNSWITKGKIRKIDIIPTNSNKENKVTNEWRDNLILFSHLIFFFTTFMHTLNAMSNRILEGYFMVLRNLISSYGKVKD